MNYDTSFSMDDFMENILKTTKPKLARRKNATDKPTGDTAVQPEVTDKPVAATVPSSGFSSLVARAIHASQTADKRVSGEPPTTSEFSDVFCNQKRQQPAIDTKAAQTEEKVKVAAYIRVSTDSADQENSYETQEQYFNRLLNSNKQWTSVGIYSDYGISGTNKDKRTGFKRLLRHCQEGRINRIVCKSISRFARNTADFLSAMQVLKDNNVTILFEKECLDTADPMNDFVVTTLAAVAQQEAYSISENIRLSMDKRSQNGEAQNVELYGYCFNGKTITMDSGYKYKDLDIVEEEAVVVRRIFEQLSSGCSYQQVAAQLNADGVPAPKPRANRSDKTGRLHTDIDAGWTAQRVSYIAHNERYVGNVRINKTYTSDCLTHKVKKNTGEVPQFIIHNHHPAIIDRELYNRTVERLAAHTPRSTSTKASHLLSGMIVCGHCGRFFNVRNSSNPVWFCPSTALRNGKTICRSAQLYETHIEQMLRKAMTIRFNSGATTTTDLPTGNLKHVIEAYAASKNGFLDKMRARLEAVQKHDNTERDRAYMGKRLTAIRLGNEAIERRIALLSTQKEALFTRRKLLNDGSVTDKRINQQDAQIEQEQHRLASSRDEEIKIQTQFAALEEYWEALEDSYDERKETIKWLETVDEQGFFNELLSHIRAFVFTITVHSANHFTIHWFDNSTSDIKFRGNLSKGTVKKKSTKQLPRQRQTRNHKPND